ncbi:MAG: type III polyketide synthase [Gemmatimonadales bacterium]|nr:MAG: type III polyketide synthase [Gemmatimonadales bacterium]
MPVFLHGLTTAVPEPEYDQGWTCDLVQEHATERRGVRRIIRSIYRNSGIRKRHSVIDDWSDTVRDPLFFDSEGQLRPTPGTARRNEVYTREARRLFVDLARKLVRDTPGFTASDVTHVITVSCTGFFAPGPDYHVVRALGLPGTTQRYHVGFMGCYAAFQGLRMAHAFCRSDPEAVVLVLSVELCTLHLKFTEDTDELIAGAVFADGGAGALVSAREPHPGAAGPAVELESFHTALTEEGEEDMAWTIGDQGFRMRLSTYVPEIIRTNLAPVLTDLLGRSGVEASEVDHFAIHPGGRAILDKVEATLGMAEGGLLASRRVLQEFGNMSSATILFVLDELLRGGGVQSGDRILAMAFGPGLTIESGLFRAP